MRCLTRIELQAYVDDETGEALKSLVKDHLKECEKCARLYDEVVADRLIVLDALDVLGKASGQEPVPSFRYPEAKRRRKILPMLVVVVAAASILAVALILKPVIVNDKQANDLSGADVQMEEYYEGRDLNKMWHERSQPLVIKDEDGNILFID